MSYKNRGLGRGLEALLVDVAPNEDRSVEVEVNRSKEKLSDAELDNNLPESAELAIHQECAAILAEALLLKQLMYEIEQQLRDF